jgi:sigma-B regulation protein RsbU (phosphoserine phosphatase)
MGGDLLDVVETDGRVSVAVADVSGHGVKAGVVMGMVKSAMRMKFPSNPALRDLLTDLNRVVVELAGDGMFVTFACLRFEGPNRAIFAGAGHGPILHYAHSERALRFLSSDNLPLGVTADETFAESPVACAPGDVLLFVTDGLTEVFDATGKTFGQESIERLLVENAGRSLSEIADAIWETVQRHGPQTDDQTLLLVRIR